MMISQLLWMRNLVVAQLSGWFSLGVSQEAEVKRQVI